MDSSQRSAGLAFLCIGLVLGAVALALAINQHAAAPVLISACIGIAITICITLVYWQTALERSGFYGEARKSAAYSTPREVAPSRVARAAMGLGTAALVAAGFALGLTPMGLVACLASLVGAMSLGAGAVHFGLLAAARRRDGA